jgi:hypothetical protein
MNCLLCRYDVWEILYKICIFSANHITNVAAIIQQSHLYYGFRFILRKLYTEPSIGASYQLSINLVKWF